MGLKIITQTTVLDPHGRMVGDILQLDGLDWLIILQIVAKLDLPEVQKLTTRA